MIPTASATVGPFFPAHFFGPGDHDLTYVRDSARRALGQRIRISGRVFEAHRVPRWNTILEIWQADANGCFAHPSDPRAADADPNFMGWGRRWTQDDGYFDFFSVKPGGYRDPVTGSVRAPHINLSIMGSGLMRRLTTTLFFADEAANRSDPVLNAVPEALHDRLMLKPAEQGEPLAYELDIFLQGEGVETPFFED